jgi:hypothetical protein
MYKNGKPVTPYYWGLIEEKTNPEYILHPVSYPRANLVVNTSVPQSNGNLNS